MDKSGANKAASDEINTGRDVRRGHAPRKGGQRWISSRL
jgi:hypothetical protein